MKKYIVLLLTATLGLSSCEDFLTVVPETQLSSATFFKTETDFEQAVNAAYVPLRSIVNTFAWRLSEMHSDNTYYGRNVLFGAVDPQEDLADFAVPTANGVTANNNVLQQYRLDYQIIARANQVLALIDEAEISQEVRDNVKGQALFLRAYAYFELVRYFGSVPLHLTPVATREASALPLSSEDEIYTSIINDLVAAVPILPPKSQQEPGRVTSGAARTLLANVYINRKQWSDAEAILTPVVTSGEYMLMPTYDMAFSENASNKNNAESVFEVQFLEGAAGLNGNFIYLMLPRPLLAEELVEITGTINPQPIDGEGNNIPTPDIIAAYEEGDEREEASIGYVFLSNSFRDDKTYPYIKKYAKKHSQHNNTGTNFPIYRYSEVLLFMAEILNEQGKDGEARNYINQVRERAGLGPVTSSGDELADAIFRERRVELAFENKRWFDIQRKDLIEEIIIPYGERIVANPLDYYYPPLEGAVPRPNVFTNLDKFYGLPAAESDLSPYF
ncbi:RagB/SusD family nutrient uptake outer membrane protein [Algoriphagus halophytocola]|uniref:RagB/SusD family nutrient uptake outer membrane protein n=1 Tax=Algoriphagus halophytocola TaxID=2991499 RepID=A0ABY6MMP7_9BACT|nr:MULTISPECIES: RagB/SusD family nutrient uptake outer membrane protein [unclassified Algoriphagus]UZD24433.1 RagB/SusD family nutrient uptake outer membrane protein [Algoriphagus sp. TR-M5]WBL41797.1 RagB/SusD family nutrient uptake outer membrane protein [Algoriphagus sp. TR-M9]